MKHGEADGAGEYFVRERHRGCIAAFNSHIAVCRPGAQRVRQCGIDFDAGESRHPRPQPICGQSRTGAHFQDFLSQLNSTQSPRQDVVIERAFPPTRPTVPSV